MDASWVAERKAREEARRRELLRGLLEFADAEQEAMLMEPDGEGPRDGGKPWDGPDELSRVRDIEMRSRVFRHRWDEMDTLRNIATRMLDRDATEDDEFRMLGILGALEIELRLDRALRDEEEAEGVPAKTTETMGDRLCRACGTEEVRQEMLPLLVPVMYGSDYDRCLDETIKLPRGNYVITDPCYLLRGDEDYDGLEGSLSVFRRRDNLYGDWGCTLYKVMPDGTGEEAGRFCADSGQVCVADWDEAAEHNPEAATWPEERPWTMAVVRDFEGTATFRVTEDWGMWQSRKPDHVDYKLWHDYEMRVVLEGTHGGSGEPVRYEGRQTSL